jgi:hypothetical protein
MANLPKTSPIYLDLVICFSDPNHSTASLPYLRGDGDVLSSLQNYRCLQSLHGGDGDVHYRYQSCLHGGRL